jgi:hypothetical protein
MQLFKKFGSVSFGVAIVSTLLLLGSFIFTVQKLVTHAAVSNWQRGASILSQYPEDFASANFKQSVQNLKSTGANSVSLIIPYWQPNDQSSDIQLAQNGPSDQTLISAINYIHGLGMQVLLKPHLETGSGNWRALIDPTNRDTWYANYSAMLNHLGDIGKQTNVETICMGTELIYTSAYTVHPDNTQRWITMINSLRTHFNGKLTYSANWGPSGGVTDEEAHIGFWSNLDAIGLSAYFNLTSTNADYDSLKSVWDTYRISTVEPLYNQYQKPIVFTEIGYRSVSGAHNQPWNYNLAGAADQQEQADDYNALFKYWDQYPYMQGVQLWNWHSNPNAGGANDTGYTPQNKLAQGVMTTWFGGSGVSTGNNNDGSKGGNTGGTSTTTVATSTPSTPSVLNISTPPQTATVHKQVIIPVTVSNTGTLTDANVDVEIYNQSGSMVFQKFFEHQNISNSNPGKYSILWTPTTAATYIIKSGVFSNDWKTNFIWNNDLMNIIVNTVIDTGTDSTTTATSTNQNPVQNPVPTVSTLTASVNGTTAILSGTVNMNTGDGRAWFEYGDNVFGKTYGEIWSKTVGVTTVSGSKDQTITATITDLKPNTTYYYHIKSENYTGTYSSAAGNTVMFTTSGKADTNGTPSGDAKLAVPTVTTLPASVNGTSANIAGTVNMHGGTGHTWFQYGFNQNAKTYAEIWPGTAGVVSTSGLTSTTHNIYLTNLTPHTTYYYRIVSENELGQVIMTTGETKTFTIQ